MRSQPTSQIDKESGRCSEEQMPCCSQYDKPKRVGGEKPVVAVDSERDHASAASPVGDTEGIDAEFAKLVSGFIEQYRPTLEALSGHMTREA